MLLLKSTKVIDFILKTIFDATEVIILVFYLHINFIIKEK